MILFITHYFIITFGQSHKIIDLWVATRSFDVDWPGHHQRSFIISKTLQFSSSFRTNHPSSQYTNDISPSLFIILNYIREYYHYFSCYFITARTVRVNNRVVVLSCRKFFFSNVPCGYVLYYCSTITIFTFQLLILLTTLFKFSRFGWGTFAGFNRSFLILFSGKYYYIYIILS